MASELYIKQGPLPLGEHPASKDDKTPEAREEEKGTKGQEWNGAQAAQAGLAMRTRICILQGRTLDWVTVDTSSEMLTNLMIAQYNEFHLH